jgi:hypothetical protein
MSVNDRAEYHKITVVCLPWVTPWAEGMANIQGTSCDSCHRLASTRGSEVRKMLIAKGEVQYKLFLTMYILGGHAVV